MAAIVPIGLRGASRARRPRVSARPEAVGEAFHVPQTLLATPPAALAPDTRSQQEQGPWQAPTNIPSRITRVHPAAANIVLPPPLDPERTAVVDHGTSSPRRRRRRRRRARCTCAIIIPSREIYAALVEFVGYVSIAGRFLLVTFLCIIQ